MSALAAARSHRRRRRGAGRVRTPDAVEQPVPGGATFDGELDRNQRSVGETTDDIDGRLRRHLERGQYVLDSGERRAIGEAAEGPQSALIIGEQQVIAPRDRRLERT
jgi:hypothetical protein